MRSGIYARLRQKATLAAACVVSICSLSASSTALAADDYVLRWQDRFLEHTRAANAFLTNASGVPIQADCPPEVSRDMAILNTSIFNAANAFDRRYQMYGGVTNLTPAAGASQEAAVIEAARVSMRSFFPSDALFPNRAVQIDQVAQGMFDELTARGISAASIDAGRAVGSASANNIVALRSNDKAYPTVSWPESTDFGRYRTDLFSPQTNVPAAQPQWGKQTPWTMTSGSQFRRNNIPTFSSPEYAAAVEQVRTMGSLARLGVQNPSDPDAQWEKRTAFFWAQKGVGLFGKTAGGTTTPGGQWLQVTRELAAARNDDMVENARVMALLSIALADAGIAAWDMKFDPTNNLWRPIHAIRLAAVEGDPNFNPGITRDTSWSPLLPTSNHPEYVSGHSTFSGAAAALLTAIYGDDVSFTLHGDDALWLTADGQIVIPNTPGAAPESRTYANFWAAAEEAGMSRIYGGIHYSFSNVNGLAAGQDVGLWVLNSALQPVPEPGVIATVLASSTLFMRRRRRV